jgi:hypothetical protein
VIIIEWAVHVLSMAAQGTLGEHEKLLHDRTFQTVVIVPFTPFGKNPPLDVPEALFPYTIAST